MLSNQGYKHLVEYQRFAACKEFSWPFFVTHLTRTNYRFLLSVLTFITREASCLHFLLISALRLGGATPCSLFQPKKERSKQCSKTYNVWSRIKQSSPPPSATRPRPCRRRGCRRFVRKRIHKFVSVHALASWCPYYTSLQLYTPLLYIVHSIWIRANTLIATEYMLLRSSYYRSYNI